MADYSTLISNTEALGNVTRNFADSIGVYASDADTTIKTIGNAAKNSGWSGETHEAFVNELNNRLQALTRVVEEMQQIRERLQEAAEGYDQFIAILKDASDAGN